MTDRRLKDDLNRLIDPPRQLRPPLAPAAGQAAIAGFGVGRPGPTGGGTGGGIASPLTEPDAADRTYHPEQALTSSDGVFTLLIEPLHRLVLQDANSAEVVVEYAIPPAP